MKSILITGVNGFVGKHLVNELVENKYTVLGVGKGEANIKGLTKYYDLDLVDPKNSDKIDFSNVSNVIHLAGLAAVGPSFSEPNLYVQTNMGIEINLFESALKQKMFPKFLIISTGNLYDTNSTLPLTEDSPLSSSSPYSISKIGQELIAQYYGLRGFQYVIARPFNHIGPGQSKGFLIPDIVEQLVNIKKNDLKVISMGNTKTKRDYTDVRDIVRAYRLLMKKGKDKEIYNICSGRSVSAEEILTLLRKVSGLNFDVSVDPTKLRVNDINELYGSNSKITKDTGWQPIIGLKDTLRDVFESCYLIR